MQMMLITELMDGGDLRKRIRQDTAKPRKTGWYQDGCYIALSIARGLVFLHDQRTVWFDCKPSNVLLDKSGTIAKIADFGLAKVLESTYTIGYQVTPCMVGFYYHDNMGKTGDIKRGSFYKCSKLARLWDLASLSV